MVHQIRRHPLGVYRGLAFGLELHPHTAPDAFLEGAATRHAPLARDAGPRAVLNALDRLAGGYEAQLATARKDLGIAQGQLRDYQARLGQPFAHDAYLAELTHLRDELKAVLSGLVPEPEHPPAGEIAERIRTLKASHTVEATPVRESKRSTQAAEEPVTTRIRKHAGVPPSEPMTEPPPTRPAFAVPTEDGDFALLEISLPSRDRG
jgi:hypothetical protein